MRLLDDFLKNLENANVRSSARAVINRQKFTFAELEENEHDLLKLTSWLHKIQRRDFFRGPRSENAVHALARCRHALDAFTATVYAKAGLEPTEAHAADEEEP